MALISDQINCIWMKKFSYLTAKKKQTFSSSAHVYRVMREILHRIFFSFIFRSILQDIDGFKNVIKSNESALNLIYFHEDLFLLRFYCF